MKVRSFLTVALCLAIGATVALAQTESTLKRMSKGKMNVPQDELVSFKADVLYSDAITAIGEISKKIDGKIIVDRTSLRERGKTIGINIESMYWKDALELILRSNQVWYNEYPEYREIVAFDELGKTSAQGKPGDAARTAATPGGGITGPVGPSGVGPIDSSEFYSKLREITVSSVFFEINQTKLQQTGLKLSMFRGSDLNLGITLDGTAKVTTPMFQANVKPTGPQDNPNSKMFANVEAGLTALESDQVGEVIARPQVTVRSGSSSRIQIGQSFSTREKDFSGNIVEKFYETGTILTVSPRVFRVGDVDFIDLRYILERSTPQVGPTTTLVNKTIAQGSLSLLNGEESYVGGLYSNDVTTTREGIPFLKDLPWWVFGLRYLFGYDSQQLNKKELVVVLKAEMLPLVEERMAVHRKTPKNVIQERLKEGRTDLDKRTTMKKEMDDLK